MTHPLYDVILRDQHEVAISEVARRTFELARGRTICKFRPRSRSPRAVGHGLIAGLTLVATAWLTGCAWQSGGRVTAPPPVNALAYYNAAAVSTDGLLGKPAPAALIELNRVGLNGWGFPSLVRRPSARPGELAAFEDAAPLGFSRSEPAAAVLVPVKRLPAGHGTLSGVLEPVGLKFRHPAKVDAQGRLVIPVPVACLAPGDYCLKVRLEVDGTVEGADLPIIVGPYLQVDRFHTYFWNAGGANEEQLAAQMRLAKRVGIDVLDTAYLPAEAALRNGLFVSAHYVTIYGGEVKEKYAAVEPFLGMAREQSEAIGDMARRYRHIIWCIPNSEYGSDAMVRHPAYEAAMKAETGLGFADVQINTSEYPIMEKSVPALAPGVYAHDLKELTAHRFARREGLGWFRVNRCSADILRRRAPELRIWTDPVFTMEQFAGIDAASFWHYPINPYDAASFAQQAECARRLNGGSEVFMTLSQWYCGVEGATASVDGGEPGWGLRSPDQHRLNAWLTLTLPVHALGYWQIGELEKNPECEAALKQCLTEIVYPYGTMLKGTTPVATPVAVYLSSNGEFLERTDRPYNFWFYTHYLNGVRPALFERFKGRVDWLDDADVLAGRLKDYKLVLCPLFRATTDRLLARIKEYQAAGGIVACDELWRVTGFEPSDLFPGQDPAARNVPYANAELWKWQKANRDAIVRWQPKGFPPEDQAFAIDVSAPDVIPALRQSGSVRYAVLANNRFQKGRFARDHGYTGWDYLDQGVSQDVDVQVKAPANSVVYDAVTSRLVDPASYTVAGDRIRLRVTLPAGGGALYVFHPRPIVTVLADPGTAGPVAPGTILNFTVSVLDDRNEPIPGQTVVKLDVTDAGGQIQDVSGFHPVRNGVARLPFGVPVSALPGAWTLTVTDLTSGLTGRADLTVAAGPGQAGN